MTLMMETSAIVYNREFSNPPKLHLLKRELAEQSSYRIRGNFPPLKNSWNGIRGKLLYGKYLLEWTRRLMEEWFSLCSS